MTEVDSIRGSPYVLETRSIPDGRTPLYHAVIKRSLNDVIKLLGKISRMDASRLYAMINVTTNKGVTPLYYASYSEKDIEILTKLLEFGADPNIKAIDTPLHQAARGGNKPGVMKLLEAGANPIMINYEGKTPWDLAKMWGNSEIEDILIEATLSRKDISTSVPKMENAFKHELLKFAVMDNKIKIVRELLNLGIDPNITGKLDRTPLHYVKNREIAVALLRRGADPNVRDRLGNTPLHSVLRYEHQDVMMLLVSLTNDIDTKNDDGKTPLSIASTKGYKPIVDELIRRGANTDSI